MNGTAPLAVVPSARPGQGGRDRYVMLMASLPHLRDPFGVDRPPINRIRLEERLRWMDPADRALLAWIERMLAWEQLPMVVDDAALVAEVEKLLTALAPFPALSRLVLERIELRSVMAALRRRRAGEAAPAQPAHVGHGPSLDTVLRHWEAPTFRLEYVHGWLAAAERMLAADDAVGIERLLVDTAWGQLDAALRGEYDGTAHHFDLEAVVIWVLRWGLVDRCVRQAAEPAQRRFAAMLAAALAPHRATLDAVGEEHR